jgi:pimeloyl-ACP methyl ester carboxylesterase
VFVFVVGAALLSVAACAPIPTALIRSGPDDEGERIPGLDMCDHDSPGILELDPDLPLVLLVHGCKSSGGRFRALSRVFEAHGQQAVCFNYDDRDRLRNAAAQLAAAIKALKTRISPQRITILGHSQGGLVARRALLMDRPGTVPVDDTDGFTYRLLTVSSPLGGIRASVDCGRPYLHYISLGLTHVVCHGISGDKWVEIFPQAPFVKSPGTLNRAVVEYVKVVTDERGTCRRHAPGGRCAEDDYVFSVAEQYNPAVDQDPRVENIELSAGHVEIVGTEGTVPVKLLDILRDKGILSPVSPARKDAIARLIADLYR